MNVVKDLSFLDMVLLMAPIALLMFLTMFRMDERVASRQTRVGSQRKFCEVGRDGRGILSDPDGKSENRDGFRTPREILRRKFVQSASFPPGE